MALLEGFLVRLGFEVDEDSAAKMRDTARKGRDDIEGMGKKAESSSKSLQKMGKRAAAMVGAIAASVLKASSDLSKMYMTAARSGTSISNIRAMGYALTQVGGDSEQAMQSIETLRTKFRDLPGLASGFASAFNVNAIDKQTGKMRDMVDILTDLGKEWRNLSSAAVSQQASFLGIDPTTAELIRSGEFERFYAQGKEMQKQMGVDLDESAKRTAQFMSDINSIWETFKVGSLDLLTSAVGDWMHQIATDLPSAFKSLKDGFSSILSQFKEDFFGTLWKLVKDIVSSFSIPGMAKKLYQFFTSDEEDGEKKSPGFFSNLLGSDKEEEEAEEKQSVASSPAKNIAKTSVSSGKEKSIKTSANEFGSKANIVTLSGKGEARPLEYPGFSQPAQAASSPTYVEDPAQVVTTAAKESSPTSVTNDNRKTVDNSQASKSSSVQVNQSIVINGSGYSSADAIQQAAYDGTQSAIRDSASVIR